jgi:hypothetical protein
MRHKWQRGRHRDNDTLADRLKRFGLIRAPHRESMSDAMRELVERDALERELEEQWWRREAAEVRRRREQEHFEALKALCLEFGSDVVERLSRRAGPDFQLPEALRGIEPNGKLERSNSSEATGAGVELPADLTALDVAAKKGRHDGR